MSAAADLLSHSSYDPAKYKREWLKVKAIRSSILSYGEYPEACSRVLSIALNHKEIAFIMAVTSAILPKNMPIQLPDMNKRKIFSHATSVGNKQKQIEYRNTFFISNIVSIVSSPSEKADQKEVHAIKDLLQFIMSSAYFQ